MEKETVGDRYKDYSAFANEYKKCDILITYTLTPELKEMSGDKNSECVYRFHSCKRGASCDKLIEALGGSSLNQRAGVISASKDLLKLDSNRYYILEINHSVGRMWEYLPLRDCSNFPHHLL